MTKAIQPELYICSVDPYFERTVTPHFTKLLTKEAVQLAPANNNRGVTNWTLNDSQISIVELYTDRFSTFFDALLKASDSPTMAPPQRERLKKLCFTMIGKAASENKETFQASVEKNYRDPEKEPGKHKDVRESFSCIHDLLHGKIEDSSSLMKFVCDTRIHSLDLSKEEVKDAIKQKISVMAQETTQQWLKDNSTKKDRPRLKIAPRRMIAPSGGFSSILSGSASTPDRGVVR